MLKVNQREKEYKFGDSGPKYLMQGPRINFGIMAVKPGMDYKNHYHEHMEENFFILEGKLDFCIDGKWVTGEIGDLIHVEPFETHYLINNYDEPAKAIITLGPYTENDKIETD